MYPYTPGYDVHIFAYLQAWRQFLEQGAAMVPGPQYPSAPFAWPTMPSMPIGGQFMPPAAPFMPPMPPFMAPTPAAPAPPTPPGPPAPGDYTQQLFSYLQAWRQYLEQMTGAATGSAQASQASSGQQPTANNRPADDSGKGSNPSWPPSQLAVPPENPGGSQLNAQANQLVDVAPTSEYRSEFRRPGVNPTDPFGQLPDAAQLLNPPDYAFGYRDISTPATFPAGSVTYTAVPEVLRPASEAPAPPPVNSAFSAIMERVEPIASPPAAPESLFRTLAE